MSVMMGQNPGIFKISKTTDVNRKRSSSFPVKEESFISLNFSFFLFTLPKFLGMIFQTFCKSSLYFLISVLFTLPHSLFMEMKLSSN